MRPAEFTARVLDWFATLRAQGPALAARPHALPGVGLGDHAAADPGGHRHPLLPALHGALSGHRGTGRRRPRPGAAATGRGSATTRARATCTQPRALSPGATGRRFPDSSRPCWRCRASGAPPPGRSWRWRCGQRHPILDGNVKRVLARFHAVDGWPGQAAVLRPALWHWPRTARRSAGWRPTRRRSWISARRCARAARPACGHCPVAADCAARAAGRQADFPAPRPRKVLPRARGTACCCSATAR